MNFRIIYLNAHKSYATTKANDEKKVYGNSNKRASSFIISIVNFTELLLQTMQVDFIKILKLHGFFLSSI